MKQQDAPNNKVAYEKKRIISGLLNIFFLALHGIIEFFVLAHPIFNPNNYL